MEQSACRRCGGDLPATTAGRICARCGQDAERRNLKATVGVVLAMVVLLMGAIWVTSSSDDPGPRSPEWAECTSEDAGAGDAQIIDCVAPVDR